MTFLRTSLLSGLLLATIVITSGCVNPGHFAGGGQFAIAPLNGGCAPETLQNCERAPFSVNLQAIDRDKDGLLDEGDTIKGHLSIQIPKGNLLKRANANILFGGVCADNDLSCLSAALETAACFQTPNCQLPQFFSPVVNSPAVTDFVRLHPKQGSTFLAGFFRLSAKNPDSCVPQDVDCLPYVAVAFDGDQSNGPSANDAIMFYSPFGPLTGFLEKGNLSITSATVTPVP